jgi:hypothetical protein
VLHDHHIELHDDQARERGANTFRLLKKQFGMEVLRMIEVNSLPLAAPNLKQKDLWAAEVARGAWMQQRGTMFSTPQGAGAMVPQGQAAAAAAASVSADSVAAAASSSSSRLSAFPPVELPAGEVRCQFLSSADLSGVSVRETTILSRRRLQIHWSYLPVWQFVFRFSSHLCFCDCSSCHGWFCCAGFHRRLRVEESVASSGAQVEFVGRPSGREAEGVQELVQSPVREDA